ncbi:MAG: hypothetical protein ACQEQC_05405 [Elusimicrobiota bacterium]
MNKLIKKIIITAVAFVFYLSYSGLTSVAWSFDDVSGDVNSVTQKFSDEGLLGSFIYKYGRSRFRPNGNVTREDLILVLGEYHNLVSRIMSQNDQIMDRLENMDAGGGPDMDTIIREFQGVLDPMLQNSDTIKELERQVGQSVADGSGGGDGGSFDASGLRNEIRDLEERVENIKDSGSGSSEVMAKMDRLESKIESMGKDQSGSSNVSRKIESLEDKIEEQNKDMRRIARSGGGDGGGASFPFWARTSVGISTLALFFMAR